MALPISTIVSNLKLSLANKVVAGDVTFTIASNLDKDGLIIPNAGSFYCMLIDKDSTNEEHIYFTLTGTTATAVKHVSRQGVDTVGFQKPHGIGAELILTDFSNMKTLSDNAGGGGLIGTILSYASNFVPTLGLFQIPAWDYIKTYVDGVAIAGSPDASTTVKGISKVSVAPVLASDPIAVGDNDTRLPTQSENDAMQGTNGTPSTLNKYVTAEAVYVDGISTQNLTENTTQIFGLNDAINQRLKIAQSFTPVKSSLVSVIVKKDIPVVGFGALSGAGATASFAGAFTQRIVGNITFNVNFSSSNNFFTMNGIATGLQVGDVILAPVPVFANTGGFYIGSTAKITAVSSTQVTFDRALIGTGNLTFNLAELQVTGTGTTFTTQVTGSIFRTSASVDYIVKSVVNNTFLYLTEASPATSFSGLQYFLNASLPNVTCEIYTDVAGVPTSLLGVSTITSAVWSAAAVNSDLNFTFTPITGLLPMSQYWLVLSSSIPSATTYPTVRKAGTDVYSGGQLKFNNTSQGWTAETGDLYFKVLESINAKLVATDNTGKLPINVIPVITGITNLFTPSSNQILQSDTQVNIPLSFLSPAFTKQKEIQIYMSGLLTVEFAIFQNLSGSLGGYIAVNGVQKGVLRSTPNNVETVYSENIRVGAGDYVQIYVDTGSVFNTLYIKNFRIKADVINNNSYGITVT